jgi:uncharacterized protein
MIFSTRSKKGERMAYELKQQDVEALVIGGAFFGGGGGGTMESAGYLGSRFQ